MDENNNNNQQTESNLTEEKNEIEKSSTLINKEIDSINIINNDIIKNNTDISTQPSEPYGKNQQQSDLDEFTRKLEEAMKKESENSTNNANQPSKPVVKKVVKPAPIKPEPTEKKEDDEDGDQKLNKTEIESKVNSMIGEETANLMASSKWDEKKTGITNFNDWILLKINEDLSLITNNIDNFMIFMKMKLKDYKESNVNIIREACLVYNTLITNFMGKGLDKKQVTNLIKGLFEKIGEARLKDTILNLLLVMMENVGPKNIINCILKLCNNEKKSPSNAVLKEYSVLLEKSIEEFGITHIPVKEVVEFCKMLSGNTNPQVRTSSTVLLCAIYKYLGKDLKTLLKDIKESTLKVIEAELDKVTIFQGAFIQKRELKPYALKEEGIVINKGTSAKGLSANTANSTASIMDSLIPRVDISKKLTQKLLNDINTGKWPEKKEAGEALEKILTEANMKILPNGLNDLFGVFKARLSDGNKNVVRLIVNLLGKIIDASGAGFKAFTKIVSTPLINNLSDKMQMLREDVLVCMDKWVTNAGLDSIILYIPALLKADNFEMRTELFKFLNKHKEGFVFLKDKFDLKEFVLPLLSCLQDKSLPIRNSSEELIAYLLRFIPLSNFENATKDFKNAIANTLRETLNKHRKDDISNEMGISLSTTLTTREEKIIDHPKSKKNEEHTPTKKKEDLNKALSTTKIKTENISSVLNNKKPKNATTNSDKNFFETNNHMKDELQSNSVTFKGTLNSSKVLGGTINKNRMTMGTSQSKKIPNSILQQNPISKVSKEKRLETDKKFKFNLETLNDDFANKLKDMLKLLFTSEFTDKLFHDEIKFFIEGLGLINNIFKENKENNQNLNFNIFDYLDLILKLVGWRSNNNQNPQLVKIVLDFIDTLSERIIQNNYELNEIEGYIIISILIDKLGINNKIKETARILIGKFSIPGLFSHIVNISLNTGKNSKVKIECMEICAGLISANGIGISPNKDIKSIAKMLTVNDNLLKNSVISFLSEVYIQIKDNLWTILNDIPVKTKEMLYNKFYNAGLVDSEGEEAEAEAEAETNEVTQNEKSEKIEKPSQNITSTNNIKTIKSSKITSDENLIQIKTSTAAYQTISNENLMSNSNLSMNDSKELLNILNLLNEGEISERVNIILLIHELVYTKFAIAKNILVPNIDIIIKAFITSLRGLFNNKNLNDIPIKLGKYLLTVLYKISSNKELIQNISFQVLFELTEEVLSNLLIENLDKIGENQEGVIIIRSLNSTMLRLLENCNYTEVIQVLLMLVQKYMKSEEKVKISGLAIKCLLKINQILPQIIDNILVDKILGTIHELLINFESTNPNLVTNNQSDQMVLRYIKNLINELVKLRRESIKLDYLKALDQPELKDKYLKRWITNILASLNSGTNLLTQSTILTEADSMSSIKTSTNFNPMMTSQTFQRELSENKLDTLIAYKTRLQQSKSPVNDRVDRVMQSKAQNNYGTNQHSSPINLNSPSKRPRNSEMYNKIINLKSKLANYNNSAVANKNDDTKSLLSKTFANEGLDSSPLQTAPNDTPDTNRDSMYKINELKKKWNDVSSKSRAGNLTPDKYTQSGKNN